MKKFIKMLSLICFVTAILFSFDLQTMSAKTVRKAVDVSVDSTIDGINAYVTYDDNTYDNVKISRELKIVNVEYRDTGDSIAVITNYSNGSWSYCDNVNAKYEFCPIELGDWSYDVKSELELENIIQTYKSIYENGYY